MSWRDLRCGEPRPEHEGREMTLAGWAARRRDHGGLVFVDLRDETGVTQLVLNPEHAPQATEVAHGVRNEFVLQARGTVVRRSPETVNPKMATGEVEVQVEELTVLSASTPLPFQLDEDHVDEALRMKYRWLDLRREHMQRNIRVRAQLVRIIREEMEREGFLDIETPMLWKPTPEGARDFVVPSRLQPGKFYALPQSPQIAKQLLVISGFELYYQIARCMRDEDPRADRLQELTSPIAKFLAPELLERWREPGRTLLFGAADERLVAKVLGLLRLQLGRELGLVDESLWKFLWVVDMPAAEWDEQAERWIAAHHPFTRPTDDSIEVFKTDPGAARAVAYDLVANGIELAGGSFRIHEPWLQQQVFENLGIGEEEQREKFGFLLDALAMGAPPHGGIASGIDRLTMALLNEQYIRDTQAFPKNQAGYDYMTEAPIELSDEQLDELGLRVVVEADVT